MVRDTPPQERDIARSPPAPTARRRKEVAVVASRKTATVTLPTDEQILITRGFDAPNYLVYRAWTTPELVKRWWGGERGEVTSAEIDLRVGGAWRCVMVTEGGCEVAFHGEYLEIVPTRVSQFLSL
jgi:hypothetical protein